MVVILLGTVAFSNQNPVKSPGNGWSTTTTRSPGVDTVRPPPRSQHNPREALTRLRTMGPPGADGKPVPFDPDFSLVLFEDFLYALYAKAHEARGGNRLDTLSAYLSAQARQSLRAMGPVDAVKAVVVGAMHYTAVSSIMGSTRYVMVRVRFETNYTEVSGLGQTQSWYAVEEWTLQRATGVKSRPPTQTRSFKCPSCGAPLDAVQGSTCSYCQKTVDTGDFDWVVQTVNLVEREPRGPLLTGTTEEQGTDLPTVKQPGVEQRMQRLLEEDAQLSWDTLSQRISLIFHELQGAWSSRRWEQARPYVSDNLFQTQRYWMEAYRKDGLRNVTENARITCLELARVTSDAYFHAVTVRLHATGLDYTVRDSDGAEVGGSRTRERRYTEYWTLIRGTGAKGRPATEKRCPSCGAGLALNMAGQCTHCSAKVTSGEFDWVLSRIEQDESYQG
jgi:predicted lipid-binding transport protein (Tim44 family)